MEVKDTAIEVFERTESGVDDLNLVKVDENIACNVQLPNAPWVSSVLDF